MIFCAIQHTGIAVESLKQFNVSVTVSYTPPLDFDRPAPYYRAASPLSLTCEVEGANGELEGVFYEWRSTCIGNCFAARQTAKTVQTAYLHSYDTGLHTCIIYDGLGCSGNASTYVDVVGKPTKQDISPLQRKCVRHPKYTIYINLQAYEQSSVVCEVEHRLKRFSRFEALSSYSVCHL